MRMESSVIGSAGRRAGQNRTARSPGPLRRMGDSRIALFLLLLGLGAPAPAARAAGDAALEQALRTVGLTPQAARFGVITEKTFGGDEFRLPLLDRLRGDPWGIDRHEEEIQAGALAASPSLHDLLVFASTRLLGETVQPTLARGSLPRWRAAGGQPGALVRAISAIQDRAHRPLDSPQLEKLRIAAGRVPRPAQTRAALLLLAIGEARSFRNLAWERSEGGVERAAGWINKFHQNPRPTGDLLGDMHSFNLSPLLQGGQILAAALEAARSIPPVQGFFSFDWETPWGRVALRGTTPDRYLSGEYMLIVDEGGDDTYQGGAVTSADCPVALVLDLGGRDIYDGGPALGIAGYGLLMDARGNDRYRGKQGGLGEGFFGIGVLWDGGGDDTYDLLEQGEGAGTFGIGALVDRAGQDTYDIVRNGQGYGGTKGAGLLVDVSGNDIYRADDTVIHFPSAQSGEHNSSQVQGAGFGWRAESGDDSSMAGGVGVLVDGSGDDSYSAGVFAQGVGYWYGIGLLLDSGGDDRYSGIWYNLGAAAHFAVGLARDGGGNDRYRVGANMGLGAGHDFSLGRMDDWSGDDWYDAPSLSLGAGNSNGIGVFWDHEGRDVYAVRGECSLGCGRTATATSLREKLLTLGIFADTGSGKDSYPGGSSAHNNASWTQPESGGALPAMGKGAGLDR